jgi:acyl-coenzyme A thioesterase PaaI-like protein
MEVNYVYCNSCSYEGLDVNIKFVRTVANGDVYECPSCKNETMNVEIDKE